MRAGRATSDEAGSRCCSGSARCGPGGRDRGVTPAHKAEPSPLALIYGSHILSQ
jgi:hypothetical protein